MVEPDPASAVGMATLLRFDISVQVGCASCGRACDVSSNWRGSRVRRQTITTLLPACLPVLPVPAAQGGAAQCHCELRGAGGAASQHPSSGAQGRAGGMRCQPVRRRVGCVVSLCPGPLASSKFTQQGAHPCPASPLLQIAEIKLRASGLARWAGNDDDPPIPTQPAAATAARPTWEQEVAEVDAARAAAAAVDAAAAAVESATEPRQQEEQQEQQQVQQQEPQPPPQRPQQQQRWRTEAKDEGLPSKGPFWRLTGSGFPEAAPLTAARQRQQQGTPAEQRQRRRQQDAEDQQQEQADVPLRPLQQEQQQQQRRVRQQQGQAKPQSLYLGVTSVPLPPAGNRAGVDSMPPRTQQELNEQQEQKEQLQAAYPAFGLRRTSSSNGNSSSTTTAPTRNGSGNGSGATIPASLASLTGSSRAKPAPPVAAAEVHLRRLDTFETLHRRAVAAITIDAPPEVRTCAQRSCSLATPVCISCCHADASKPVLLTHLQYLVLSFSACPPCRLCGLC